MRKTLLGGGSLQLRQLVRRSSSWALPFRPPSSGDLSPHLVSAHTTPPAFLFTPDSFASLLDCFHLYAMQQRSRGHAPLATRMPLSKFSHTTTAVKSHTRMVWTHINGDGDLCCEIERHAGNGFSPSSLVLRIVHNRRVLV